MTTPATLARKIRAPVIAGLVGDARALEFCGYLDLWPWRYIRVQPGGEYADYSIVLEVFNPEQEQILLRVYSLTKTFWTKQWISTITYIEPLLLDILADILAGIWQPEKLFA